MSKLKIISGYILAFIASVVLTLLLSLILLKVTVLNKNYVKDKLNSNNYYNNVSNEILDKMKNYMVSSGLPEIILEDIYDIKDVKDDINLFIDNAYLGEKTVIDVIEVKEKLNNNIDEYIKDHKVKVTSKSYIDSFVNNMVSIYDKEVSLYGMVNGFMKYVPKIIKLVDTLLVIALIVSVLLLVGLILLKVNYIGSVISASGLIMLFIRLIFLEKIDYQNILIISSEFSDMAKIVINNISNIVLIISICLILAGIILNFAKNIKRLSKNTING